MKMEEILKLIEAVSASELTDFKYEENGTKLNLKKEQQKVEIIQSPGVVPVTLSQQVFRQQKFCKIQEMKRITHRKSIRK